MTENIYFNIVLKTDNYKDELCLHFILNSRNRKIVKNNIIKHVINIIIE